MSEHNTDYTDKLTAEQLFEQEFLPHIEALNTFAFHLTYNEEDAADLVQDTYLKAFRFMDKYEKGTNAKAWLFRIMKNAYINEYRKRVRQPLQTDYEQLTQTSDSPKVADNDLREAIFDHSMGDELTTALNSLSTDFKTIILLCDIEEFSYEEIAAILEIPIGTVRSRLHRARLALKDKIKEYAANLGYNVEK